MKTNKHVITLSIKGESIKFITHSVVNKRGDISINFMSFASKMAKYDVSSMLNERLTKSAMKQIEQDYNDRNLADAIIAEQTENHLLADEIEKENKPCES